MKSQPITEIIMAAYPAMTKGQRKIADFMLEDWESLAFLTPREAGDTLKVSEATMIRFAQVLGFQNYSDLRQHLQDLIRFRLTPAEKMSSTVDKVRNEENPLQKLLMAESEILRESIGRISQTEFNRAIELLAGAKRVFLIGFGVSAALCVFLEFRLRRMQVDVRVLSHGGRAFYENLILAHEDDVFMGIGFFRCAEEIIHAFDYAGQNRIKTIAVTHSNASELAQRADVTLVANRGPVSEVNSLVVPMAVLNALTIALAEHESDRALKALERLDRIREIRNSGPATSAGEIRSDRSETEGRS